MTLPGRRCRRRWPVWPAVACASWRSRSVCLPVEDLDPTDLDERVDQLTLLGLVGLADPPRPGVLEAIAACHAAGIDVKMITGDHASTAEAIATELGITGPTCTGCPTRCQRQ